MKHHVMRRRRSKEGPSASNAKAAQSIAIIVLLFVVSWMPLYTFNTIVCFCPDCSLHPMWIKAFIVLSHCNSVWNPILYAWGMRDFKHCLGRFFGVNRGHVVLVPSGSLNRYRWQPKTYHRTVQTTSPAAQNSRQNGQNSRQVVQNSRQICQNSRQNLEYPRLNAQNVRQSGPQNCRAPLAVIADHNLWWKQFHGVTRTTADTLKNWACIWGVLLTDIHLISSNFPLLVMALQSRVLARKTGHLEVQN